MPTYQYACTECGHSFEQFQSFTDDALTECPTCGGRLRKVWGSVGIVFKGTGFYRNDSRESSKKEPAGVGAKEGGAKDGGAKEGGAKDGGAKDGGAKDGAAKDASGGDKKSGTKPTTAGASTRSSGAGGSSPAGSSSTAGSAA